MKLKRIILTITLMILLLMGSIAGISMYNKVLHEEKGHKLYSEIHSQMDGYPTSTPYTGIYYCDGTTEYMLLKNGDRQITATRGAEGDTTYYMDGKSWTLRDGDTWMEAGVTEDLVETVVKAYIQSLLDDSDITYSYHVGEGIPLPLWAYPEEEYLLCQRSRYPDLSEVIVFDHGIYGEYVRWAITRSTDDVTLFLYSYEQKWEPGESRPQVLFGWGTVEDAVYEYVFG